MRATKCRLCGAGCDPEVGVCLICQEELEDHGDVSLPDFMLRKAMRPAGRRSRIESRQYLSRNKEALHAAD